MEKRFESEVTGEGSRDVDSDAPAQSSSPALTAWRTVVLLRRQHARRLRGEEEGRGCAAALVTRRRRKPLGVHSLARALVLEEPTRARVLLRVSRR
ncbi:hypothetical protein ZWY2020_039316 [Hordeum vulgare]|nr:hypothetical protein ZWY2020_039316 [Hordeum vulgare]